MTISVNAIVQESTFRLQARSADSIWNRSFSPTDPVNLTLLAPGMRDVITARDEAMMRVSNRREIERALDNLKRSTDCGSFYLFLFWHVLAFISF